MHLDEVEAGWSIAGGDATVHLIQIDHRVGLFLQASACTAQLYLETPFQLRGREAPVLIRPGHIDSVAPVLALFGAKLSGMRISRSGHLEVIFQNGYAILIEPDDSFEAWQIASDDLLMVCPPGGDVAMFDARSGPPSQTMN